MKFRILTMASVLAVGTTVVLFAAAMAKPPTEGHAVAGLDRGVAVLVPTKGNDVEGTILFHEKDGVIHLSGEIRALTPGLHGFHIHEFGDLRAQDGTSAGGHYNPHGKPHAGPDQEARHVGDLGNVEAGANGVAKVDMKIDGAALHFIFGRSIVVHADKDDLSSQPSGNAGPRVAVGVIGIAK
jgi:Cu-Zn family superoxide dismutase